LEGGEFKIQKLKKRVVLKYHGLLNLQEENTHETTKVALLVLHRNSARQKWYSHEI
jgi:hypothetical protein